MSITLRFILILAVLTLSLVLTLSGPALGSHSVAPTSFSHSGTPGTAVTGSLTVSDSFSSGPWGVSCGFGAGVDTCGKTDPTTGSISYVFNISTSAVPGTVIPVTIGVGNCCDDDDPIITVAGTITVANTPPIADPGGPYSSNICQSVSFDGSGSSDIDTGDSITSYSWNFGDGSSDTGANPTHTYTSSGNFTVTLTVNDNNGGSHSTTTTANIGNTTPVANPGGPYSVNFGTPVSFDGSGSNDPDTCDMITSYSWDFGDGASDTGASPTHTYASSGSFTVTLTVNDENGGSHSATTTADVPDPIPTADAGGPYTGNLGIPISFDGSGSNDPEGDSLNYSWDFGDGSSGTVVSPTHTYTSSGSFTVTLTVEDGNESQVSDTTTANIAVDNDNPSAPGSVTVTTEPPSSIKVTWTAATDNVGIAKYVILLDGENFAEQTPTFTFSFTLTDLAPGSHTVGIKAVDLSENVGPVISDSTDSDLANEEFIKNLPPREQTVAITLAKIANAGQASVGLQERIDELEASIGSEPDKVEDILGQLDHEKYSNQGSTAVNIAYSNVGVLSDRLVALRGGAHGLSIQGLNFIVEGKRLPTQILTGLFTDGGEEIPSIFSKLGVFINGQIGWGDKDSTLLESGFRFNTYEITGGVDYRFTDKAILGAALSYAKRDIDVNSNGGDSDIDGVTMSLYGNYYVNDNFYIDGTVSLGFDDFDNERRISYSIASLTSGTTVVNQTMDSDTDGIQQSYSLGCGYDFNHKALTFGPYGRVTYTRTDIDSLTESASSPGTAGTEWRLAIESQEIKSFTAKFGAQASYALSTKWCVLSPQARVEWVHEFGDKRRRIDARYIEDTGATPFAIKTDDPDKDSLNFGIGLSAVFSRGKTAFVDFEKLVGYDDWSSNTVTFGFRWEL